jgi:hypothetical protein
MMEIEAVNARKAFVKEKSSRRCPDCGSSMTEVDRVNEDGFAYIWYECAETNCDGQWLEKREINLI